MNPLKNHPLYRAFLLVFLLMLLLSGCAPAAGSTVPATAAVQTVEWTAVETRLVTSEVTQVVEIPVTNTPTITPDWTATPSFSPTVTKKPTATTPWEPPRVQVLSVPGSDRTMCWYGPGTGYLPKYSNPTGVWMRAIGRSEDGAWVVIKAGDDPDSNACWTQTELLKFLSGNLKDLPVLWIALPYSVLYDSVKAVSANRVGDEVTIFFQPIWMTEDDYRGYMIEAWVCQGGKQVFRPLGYMTTYNANQKLIADKGMIALKVVDEPGCIQPSHARLYAVEKHGYTKYIMVPWPANP
jgi:hypothetical protein